MTRIENPTTALSVMLDREKDSIARMLPEFLSDNRDRFFELVLAAQKNPAIVSCTPASVLSSVYRAAQWGLLPDGVHGALVPYGRDCTFVPMYRGLIAAYRRSGDIKQVWAEVAFEGDKLEVVRGSEPKLNHEPSISGDRVSPEKVVGAYACARWSDGHVDFVWMNRSELDSIRSRSRAQNGPWKTDTVAMFRKCPLRRLASILPLQVEIQQLAADDERAELADVVIEGESVAAKPPPSTLEGLLGVQPDSPPEVWLSGIRIEQAPFEAWKAKLTGSKNPPLAGISWAQVEAMPDGDKDAPLVEKILADAGLRQSEKGTVADPFQKLAVAWEERRLRIERESLARDGADAF